MTAATDRLRRRILAAAVDVVATWPWLAVLTGAGLAYRRWGGQRLRRGVAQPAVALCLTCPVTVATAWAEVNAGTPGKRLVGLRVVDDTTGAAPSAGQSLGRTVLRTALPWELAHAGIWALQEQHSARRGGLLLACSYGLVAADVLLLAVGDGRTLADRVCGTRVVETAAGRAGAQPATIRRSTEEPPTAPTNSGSPHTTSWSRARDRPT